MPDHPNRAKALLAVCVGWFVARWQWGTRLVNRSQSDKVTVSTITGRHLRPLSPEYIDDQHGDYVEILLAELGAVGPDGPKNIALTGHYGSGKSSVLGEVLVRLAGKDVRAINVSLPNLGIGDGLLPSGRDATAEKTNWIQKEIVKQLLYRQRPSQAPASRYKRLDVFQARPAQRRAAVVALLGAAVAILWKLPSRFHDGVPARFWQWLDKPSWISHVDVVVVWASVLAAGVVAYGVAMWLQNLLQQRLRISELAAGPAKITLSEDGGSTYFDDYLDEIVYFFQTSKTTVVIFEDLDRFSDPHIFEALRELNLLLNAAEQTGAAPIRFVYAIRDSIFEQPVRLPISTDSADETADAGQNPAFTPPVDDSEGRRLSSTNRTKFFDMVIPMVPFISHRTSRDYIQDELSQTDRQDRRPDQRVIDIVARHLTDMRLIKNICNEYDVFCTRILTDTGLKELTANGLFASIVYKNVYLADYEKIRHGDSRVDALYEAYRTWQHRQLDIARVDERTQNRRLEAPQPLARRSNQLGERLQSVLLSRSPSAVTSATVTAGGTTYQWADLQTHGFWSAYLQARPVLSVTYNPQYEAHVQLPFDKIEALMNQSFPVSTWETEDRAEYERARDAAVARQREISQGTLASALQDVDSTFTFAGEAHTLKSAAEAIFGSGSLALELLSAGFIDENYNLYLSQYPGATLSASAMNFIIKSVQRDVMDIEYHFAGAEGPGIDIDSVLAEDPRVVDSQAIYNLEIFDHLFRTAPSRLADPIRRLGKPDEPQRVFIDAYLESGREKAQFVSALSGHWPRIFERLIDTEGQPVSLELLDAALNGARPDLRYEVTNPTRDSIRNVLSVLPVITSNVADADGVGRTLVALGIQAPDLSTANKPQLDAIVSRDAYDVTLDNLRTILGQHSIALDELKSFSATDVYPYVLGRLDNYIAGAEADPSVVTVVSPDAFGDVLEEVVSAAPGHLEFVAERASADCLLDPVDGLDVGYWPTIARARRLRLTPGILTVYISEHDVDEDLAEYLAAKPEIETFEDQPAPVALAVSLLNTDALDDATKLSLIESLDLPEGSVAATQLTEVAHPLVPTLVRDRIVPDDATAFTVLGATNEVIKRRLIQESANVASYLPQLSPGGQDLLDLVDVGSDGVKAAVLAGLPGYASTIGPRACARLAQWISAAGRSIDVAALQVLASRANEQDGGTAAVIRIIGRDLADIDRNALLSMLTSLGSPYDELTSPGRERPNVPIGDGIVAILDRLTTEGIVSKQSAKPGKGMIQVSKRHG